MNGKKVVKHGHPSIARRDADVVGETLEWTGRDRCRRLFAMSIERSTISPSWVVDDAAGVPELDSLAGSVIPVATSRKFCVRSNLISRRARAAADCRFGHYLRRRHEVTLSHAGEPHPTT
jgi:hypothetical protein